MFGHGKFPIQRFVDTKEEVEELVKGFVEDRVNAYFGCAKFGPADNRTHENAHCESILGPLQQTHYSAFLETDGAAQHRALRAHLEAHTM